jgi:hypothetical protein
MVLSRGAVAVIASSGAECLRCLTCPLFGATKSPWQRRRPTDVVVRNLGGRCRTKRRPCGASKATSLQPSWRFIAGRTTASLAVVYCLRRFVPHSLPRDGRALVCSRGLYWSHSWPLPPVAGRTAQAARWLRQAVAWSPIPRRLRATAAVASAACVRGLVGCAVRVALCARSYLSSVPLASHSAARTHAQPRWLRCVAVCARSSSLVRTVGQPQCCTHARPRWLRCAAVCARSSLVRTVGQPQCCTHARPRWLRCAAVCARSSLVRTVGQPQCRTHARALAALCVHSLLSHDRSVACPRAACTHSISAA